LGCVFANRCSYTVDWNYIAPATSWYRVVSTTGDSDAHIANGGMCGEADGYAAGGTATFGSIAAGGVGYMYLTKGQSVPVHVGLGDSQNCAKGGDGRIDLDYTK
jgi:hypothetical protein